MDLYPLVQKWLSFGWRVEECCGHNIDEITKALYRFKKKRDGPGVLIANTIKGKGISFMENNPKYHSNPLTEYEYVKAIAEIGACE